jgi:hypothetical protein
VDHEIVTVDWETMRSRLGLGLLCLALGACGNGFSAAHGKDAGADAQGGGQSTGGSGGVRGGAGGQTGGHAGTSAERDASSGGTSGVRDGGLEPPAGAGGAGGSKDAGQNDAGAGFVVPTDGLLLWLRADRGITEVSGKIASWADQSQHHLDAIQTDPNLRPHVVTSDGKASVEFDGADDFLQLPGGFSDFTKGLSLFVVVQPASITPCQSFVEFSNGSEMDDISLGIYEQQILYEVQDPYTQATPIVVGTPQEITLIHAADEAVVLRRNGALAQKTTFALPIVTERTETFVGKSLYGGCPTFGGRISEILLYERTLAVPELTALEQGLRDRWSCCTD